MTLAIEVVSSLNELTRRGGEVFAAGTAASGLYADPDQIDVTRVEIVAVEVEKRERGLQSA